MLYYDRGRESGRSRPNGRNRVIDFLVFSTHDMRRREIVFHPLRKLGINGTVFHPSQPQSYKPGIVFFSPFHLYNPGAVFA